MVASRSRRRHALPPPPSAPEGCPPRRCGIFHRRGRPARGSGGRRDGSRCLLGRLDSDANEVCARAETRVSRGGAHAPRTSAPRRRRRQRPGSGPSPRGVGEGAPHPRRTRRGIRDMRLARADRGSRIADRGSRRPFARGLARVQRATRRRRAPAFRIRDLDGEPAASDRGTSVVSETTSRARERWTLSIVHVPGDGGGRAIVCACTSEWPRRRTRGGGVPRVPARGRGVGGIGSGTRPGGHAKDRSVEPWAAAAVNNDASRSPFARFRGARARG